jgi:hypothetical protein
VGVLVLAMWELTTEDWPPGLVLIGVSAVVAWFSTATYRVSRDELSIRMGGGLPHLRIRGADISSVERSAVSAVRAGGLGYRGSWTFGRKVAISLGGAGGVTVRTRPKGQLRLSSDHAAELESAISSMAAALGSEGAA